MSLSLLCHFDGADLDTTTADSSVYANPLAIVATSNLSSTQKKFGSTSYYTNANGYITIPDHTAYDIASGKDFTINCWIYPTTIGTNNRIIAAGNVSATTYWRLGLTTAGMLYWELVSSGTTLVTLTATVACSINTWYHVEIGRFGTQYTLYKDGAVAATVNDTSSVPSFAVSPLIIGRETTAGTLKYAGYIDELSFWLNEALHVSAFTPETHAYGFSGSHPVSILSVGDFSAVNAFDASNPITIGSLASIGDVASFICNSPIVFGCSAGINQSNLDSNSPIVIGSVAYINGGQMLDSVNPIVFGGNGSLEQGGIFSGAEAPLVIGSFAILGATVCDGLITIGTVGELISGAAWNSSSQSFRFGGSGEFAQTLVWTSSSPINLKSVADLGAGTIWNSACPIKTASSGKFFAGMFWNSPSGLIIIGMVMTIHESGSYTCESSPILFTVAPSSVVSPSSSYYGG